MSFTVNNQPSFVLNYKDIAISNASGKNELALEFQQEADAKSQDKGDVLCEMRFYVPRNELDNLEDEKKEEEKPTKKGDESEEEEEET
mmetsp:Transcript_18827/g.17982  ORF Transcript_18827/g.17982 Transcript_18827/m.17982 type:complete len:88 (-) Transcript_18827:1179-1442(-)